MNIWLSTTTRWNPGDDFIREGVKSVLNTALGNMGVRPLYILMCRNPDNNGSMFADGNRLDLARMRDPELKPDLVVHCGTPEWTGKNVRLMLKEALRWEAPIVYLGVGSTGSRPDVTDEDRAALASTKLFIARDNNAVEEAVSLGLRRGRSMVMPCPALLCPMYSPTPLQEGAKGLIWQSSSGPQPVSRKAISGMKDLMEYDHIIFHYIGDLVAFRRENPDFPGERLFYTAEYQSLANFIRLMGRLDSMRLHGAFVAEGIVPEVNLINRDFRCVGAEQVWKGYKRGIGSTEAKGRLFHDWTTVLQSRLEQILPRDIS